MEQHIIQKSWIKQFADRSTDKVLLVNRNSPDSQLVLPKNIGFIEDFQSDQNEKFDQFTETRAISMLYRLRKGKAQLLSEDRAQLDRWVALHMTRSFRNIQRLRAAGKTYNRGRVPCLEDDLAKVGAFSDVWVKQFQEQSEPLILSDNPIVQFANEMLLLPFGSHMIVAFSNRNPEDAVFEGRSWPEAMNEMSFQNSNEFVLCNPRLHPDWDSLRERSRGVLIEVKHSQVRISPT